MPTQNNKLQSRTSNLQKTSKFICMPKITFIIHFFLEILHFKESCNLIGQCHFGPSFKNQNFGRHLSKNKNKNYFGAILGPLCPDLSKNEFSWNKGLSVFKYYNYLSPSKKSEKANDLWKKWKKKWQTEKNTKLIDRQRNTDRRCWLYRTSAIRQESNK